MAIKIKNIESLEGQIRRLQDKAKILEEKLDVNLDYLQDNYSSMIMGSIFNKEGIKNSFAGSFAGFFLGNEKLQEAVSNIVNNLAEKATIGLEKLSEKLTKKNTE
ncbi:MAG: hypothetical protein ABUT20_15995 [Bacteroidota bacterium]